MNAAALMGEWLEQRNRNAEVVGQFPVCRPFAQIGNNCNARAAGQCRFEWESFVPECGCRIDPACAQGG